jgi:hypothetical protein
MLLTNHQCFDEHSLYWLSISEGVRINQNGFLFFNTPVYMPPATTHPCPRTLNGLCQHNNYTFLPCTQNPRTLVTDAMEPFDYFWRSETKCAKRPTLYHFDIMPCDLRHGTSIVWANGKVSVQYDLDLNYWANLFVLLIMLWLIINLGECIALIMEVKGSAPHNHNTVVLCIALVAIIIPTTPDGFWATYNDIVLFWYTVGYIGAYCIYHMENRNTVNIIIGCMMLVSSRYYQTNETPYVATYLFLISTRVVQKLFYTLWGKSDVPYPCWTYVRLLFIGADITLFVLLYIFSFIPSFRSPIQAHLYLLGVLFASICLGSFIAHYAKAKQEQTPAIKAPTTST